MTRKVLNHFKECYRKFSILGFSKMDIMEISLRDLLRKFRRDLKFQSMGQLPMNCGV